MRALSIRQPYAEMILRGEKKIEYRSRATKIIGERFYIYASRQWAAVNGETLRGVEPGDLATGVIVGTAIISHITNGEGSQAGRPCHQWHLTDVRRLSRPRRPQRMPQPVWFRPF